MHHYVDNDIIQFLTINGGKLSSAVPSKRSKADFPTDSYLNPKITSKKVTAGDLEDANLEDPVID